MYQTEFYKVLVGKGAFLAIPISMEVGSNQKDDFTAISIDVLKA